RAAIRPHHQGGSMAQTQELHPANHIAHTNYIICAEVYAEPVEAKSNRAEVKSNRAQVKTNRAETDNLRAIKILLYEIRKELHGYTCL
ncbi:MAG: hypothetical protein IKN51_01595, partial [Bacteroidaceae bacterium]|nr:hypothetical protein [Bacteroidaceae bacterium]